MLAAQAAQLLCQEVLLYLILTAPVSQSLCHVMPKHCVVMTTGFGKVTCVAL